MSDNPNKRVVRLGYASVVDCLMYATVNRHDIHLYL